MNKRELRKTPIVNIKPEWKSFMNQLIHTDIKYFIATEECKDNIIILNIIDKSKMGNISYRVFISKTDYITQDFTSSPMKWRVGSLDYILGDGYYNRWYKMCALVDNKSISILSKFLGSEEGNLLRDIDILQNNIKDMRLSKKHKEIKDRIDKKMKSVPKIPKSFAKWINDMALYDSRYIYYNYKARKIVDGFCTHCSSDVKVEGPKHNKKGKCPNCKSDITYKATGLSRNILDYRKVSLIQKARENIVVRHFNVSKYYGADYRNPELKYVELARHFIDKEGKVDSYEFNNFKQTNEIRWCEGITIRNSYSMFYSNTYDFSETILYTRNLSKVLKDSVLKYSGLKEFALYINNDKFPVNSYISKYLEFPGLEYLVKMNLFKLAEDILNRYNDKYDINIYGKNMFEVLDIDKVQLATLRRINGGLNELIVIREIGKSNLNLTDEQILFVSNNIRVERIIKMSEYTTVQKMLKYVTSQSSKDRSLDYTFSDWLDYINDCRVLKYDLSNEFILFPKYLTEAHNETSTLIKDNKNELYNARITEMHNALFELFYWQFKDHVIVPPKSYDDIINEGHLLHHCVGKGSYGRKVIEGESVILFLRKKDEINKPFYTIELDANNEIKQCRGKNNVSMDGGVEKIIDMYKNQRLSKFKYLKAV